MDILENALGQGIAPAIVIAVYLIIVKIIDGRISKNQAEINNKLSDSINNISDFITGLTKSVINKDITKCKNSVEDSIYASGMRLINFVTSTIINNHIEINAKNIESNIHNIVNAEFYNVYTTLSLYIINNNKVSKFLNKEWIDEVKNDIISIIYDNKLSKEDKILTFENKINIRFQSYVTYIINNAIKE